RWEMKDLFKEVDIERVAVLKTVFNDVWENFNVHELGSTMIQTIRQYTAEWRVRDSEIPLAPRELDTLIRTDHLFARNLFADHLFEDIAADCTDVTAPLLERHFYDPDQEGKKTGFNLLNYEYWILGDRRFLLLHKQTSNMGDLVTRW
ncbi:hypothetical protein J3R83DRAFT_5410, partial [Lanmaoa asiatica]